MRSAIRLFTVLFFAISLIMASAVGALAFDPQNESPENVCWDPSDFPGVGAKTRSGNAQAWNAHIHSHRITNESCPDDRGVKR